MKQTAFHSDNKDDFVSGVMRERAGNKVNRIAPGLLGAEYKPRARNALSGRFIVPPFSVLNAREGWWQERKRAWISLGIRSELGRGENLLKFSDSVMAAQQGKPWGKGEGDARKPAIAERWQVTQAKVSAENDAARRGVLVGESGSFRTVGKSVYLLPTGETGEEALTGTSIFDPVLCEITYRWYCPEGGHVLDPFAGGSVRGIVASELGLRYTGVDLSERQLEANRKQVPEIGTKPEPRWIAGDSRLIATLAPGQYDFIFSCPPYGHLEQYSDHPDDISTMSPANFAMAYRHIILEAGRLLRPGRFACFVIGDYRDDDGGYCCLPEQTVAAFLEAGLVLYNRSILVTSVGSLPMRVNKQFTLSRKLGNTHQYAYVFAKGNPKEFLPRWPGNLLEKEIK